MPTCLLRAIPGSATLLHPLGRANQASRKAGRLLRFGASPNTIEDEDDDEDEYEVQQTRRTPNAKRQTPNAIRLTARMRRAILLGRTPGEES